MKKSLVISTIATVLVVVVALTTATFAWFSTTQNVTVGSTFEVSTAGGGLSVYTWDKAAGGTGAYNINMVISDDDFALGEYDQPFNWDWTDQGLAANGTGAADFTLNPLMPLTEIKGIFDDSVELSANGLPDVDFAAAEPKSTSQINVTNIVSKPIVARFQLAAGYVNTLGKVEVTIGIPDSIGTPTSFDVNTSKNVKFVLIGQSSATPTATNQNFIIGTNYGVATGAAVGAYETSGYTDVTISDSDGATDNIVSKNINLSGINGTNTRDVTQSVEFKMTSGTNIECLLYIWLDGENATNTSASGNYAVEIVFSGTDQTPTT